MSWIVRIFFWICLLFCNVKIKAQLFYFTDEDSNADIDLTVNPYLSALTPAICGFSPGPPLGSECCTSPPIFHQEDLKNCFDVTDLKEIDVNTLNCTKLNCVLILYKLVDADGYFIYKRVAKYMDAWAQLYPGYEAVVVETKTHCFYPQLSIYDLPCLLITVYDCYLEKIREICPVYRTEDECQIVAEYKRLCTQNPE